MAKTDGGELPEDLARQILAIGFRETDQARMRDLAERNQEGNISAAEREELQSYVKVGHLLALLHSKARRTLKPKGDH